MVLVHISAVIFSVLVVLLADKQAFAWMAGKKEYLDRQTMYRYHLLVWAGLLVTMSAGAYLAFPRIDYLLNQPLFIIKMLFVGMLVANAVLIGLLMPLAEKSSFASLSFKQKLPLLMSGAISTVAWLGAITAALLLFR